MCSALDTYGPSVICRGPNAGKLHLIVDALPLGLVVFVPVELRTTLSYLPQPRRITE